MDIHSCSYFCDRPECIKTQRDELRARLSENEYNQRLQDAATAAVLERAEKAEAKLAEAEKDAKRYRWLRPKFDSIDFAYGSPPRYVISFSMPNHMRIGASLDAAIDAEMAK